MTYEIEFKLLIPDENAAGRLEQGLLDRGLARAVPIAQVNHFFDTADHRLGQGRCILRLRVIDDVHHVLTAKGATEEGQLEGAAVMFEAEAAVHAHTGRQILAGEACPLAVLRKLVAPNSSELLNRLEKLSAGEKLEHAGQFSNLRTSFGPWWLSESCEVTLELDRTDFGKRVDWELEAETSREHAGELRAALEQLLASTGIEWRTSSTKARRYFELNS